MQYKQNLVELLKKDKRFEEHVKNIPQLVFHLGKVLKDRAEKSKWVVGDTLYNAEELSKVIDPYISKHQQRVSRLACAIAREMGLSEKKISAIRVAALLHDIGMIYIPDEIVNSKRPLSEADYRIIKTHPRIGYKILKTINFPWPIAEIVLQHHERIDGSGYPDRLAGDEMLIESKVIGLADVIDAINSNRPYRPSLGITNALDEIWYNRDILYDRTVVDACFRVFLKNKFDFYKDTEVQKTKVGAN